jgi:opacity protein-like surface antigen
VAGLGYYMSSRSDMTIDGTTYSFPSSNDFGMGLGGGIMYNISPKTSLYGEVQYNNIFASSNNITFVPFRAGIIIRP